MQENFIFPDSLHGYTLNRLGVDMQKVKDFLSDKSMEAFKGRITDISLKVEPQQWAMRFFLDGRKSGKCMIDAEKQAWVDAGVVSLYDLTMHFCTTIKPGFSKKPVQLGLFR